MDSCAIFIYNHGYSMAMIDSKYIERRKANKEHLYKKNYSMVTSGEASLEEYNSEFERWFKSIYDDKYLRVKNYVENSGIEEVTISRECDNLCEMTLDYLINRLETMENFDFELIKSACIYFSKINNKSAMLNIKTQKLRKLLYQKLSMLEFKFCQEITDKFRDEEIINIIIKLISLNGVTLDTLNEFKIIKTSSSNQDFLYASFDDEFIKIGRYSDLESDDMKSYHDPSMCGIYVNTAIQKINLSYNASIGDFNINENLEYTNKPMCEAMLKTNTRKK